MVIIVLDNIYRFLATLMVDWENHKYAEDYENSLITKNFAFTFVNSNIALFSVAFAQQDFGHLAEQLAINLAVKQITFSALDNILPKIKVSLKSWWMTRKFRAVAETSTMTKDD